MKASEPLVAEHKGIKQLLRILEAICRRLESGREVDPKHLAQIVEFLHVFVDKCHHGKEEELLFPALIEAGIPREGGPVGVMLDEHATGRLLVRGMSQAIGEYVGGKRAAASDIVRNARDYMTLLIDHIEKENQVLYVLADTRIPDKKQEELIAGYEKLERERIGPGRHETFHKLIEQLAEIYLQ